MYAQTSLSKILYRAVNNTKIERKASDWLRTGKNEWVTWKARKGDNKKLQKDQAKTDGKEDVSIKI